MTQTQRLYAILRDGHPHRTDELVARVYGSRHAGLARVGARVLDVKKKYGVNVIGWHDKGNQALYWYQLSVSQPVPIMPPAFEPQEKVEATNNQSLF